jgi:hypothetical protein
MVQGWKVLPQQNAVVAGPMVESTPGHLAFRRREYPSFRFDEHPEQRLAAEGTCRGVSDERKPAAGTDVPTQLEIHIGADKEVPSRTHATFSDPGFDRDRRALGFDLLQPALHAKAEGIAELARLGRVETKQHVRG